MGEPRRVPLQAPGNVETPLIITALGTSVLVEGLPKPALVAARELWHALTLETRPARVSMRVDLHEVDSRPAAMQSHPAEDRIPLVWQRALGRLAVMLNGVFLDRFAGFAVHAGVLEKGGRVVAIPAESGAGKTTMTAAACLAGWAYISDEALCVDYDSGTLSAYARPLGLSTWSADALRLTPLGVNVGTEYLVAPRNVASRIVTSPGQVTDVVILDRQSPTQSTTGDQPAILDPLPRTEILPLLLRRSFNHYRQPAAAVRLAASIARASGCWRLRYSDPAAGAAALATLVD